MSDLVKMDGLSKLKSSAKLDVRDSFAQNGRTCETENLMFYILILKMDGLSKVNEVVKL